jgi:hypothetical protein
MFTGRLKRYMGRPGAQSQAALPRRPVISENEIGPSRRIRRLGPYRFIRGGRLRGLEKPVAAMSPE